MAQPQIVDFEINEQTGEMTMHIQGVVGPACDNVAKLVKELMGSPSSERETAEYRLQAQRAQLKQGGR